MTKSNEDLNQEKQRCDHALHTVMELLAKEGIDHALILDRITTLSAACAVKLGGREDAAGMFRQVTALVEDGVFAHLEPETLRGTKH